jgi:adenylosuccinate lyase
MEHNQYQSPLGLRYSSPEMSHTYSQEYRIKTWHKMWLEIARAQHKLGLNVSAKQIQELENNTSIDFVKAQEYEEQVHHDVMAHLHALGDQCPSAKPILHLGATSCCITDNGDLIQMKEALSLIENKLIKTIQQFADFAEKHHNLPCLAYTHLQPAQPTTLGKRASLWLQDLIMDLYEIEPLIPSLKFRGIKGTTGTQASFLNLFNGDEKKVKELEKQVAQSCGFDNIFPITGQTYPRKQDVTVLNVLCNIAISANKFATDIRLLAHLKEIEEPFAKKQVGSSAMPHKRNPILSERICSLSRFVIEMSANTKHTAAHQWLERSLDDSANRRLTISETFMAVDGILELLLKITKNIVVNPKIIEKNLEAELPFLVIENIMMDSVKDGADRQEMHEELRLLSQKAAQKIKEGLPNDLLAQLKAKYTFEMSNLTGRSSQQVKEYLQEIAHVRFKNS